MELWNQKPRAIVECDSHSFLNKILTLDIFKEPFWFPRKIAIQQNTQQHQLKI